MTTSTTPPPRAEECMPFEAVPMGAVFLDLDNGQECRKVGERTAITPDCAPGMSAGFRADAPVKYLRQF
jgi:hypothetical protein